MPIQIVRNDITKMQVDAVVNAANRSLLGGGGVDGAIHRAAGPELLAECQTLGGCEVGHAKLTAGYRLPCRYVIHTVGPRWQGGSHGERELLISCYRTALALAKQAGCETVAFPLISAGLYGYPKDEALRIAVDTIGEFLQQNEMTVYIVIFDRAAYEIGRKRFERIAAYIDDRYVEQNTLPEERRRREEPPRFQRAASMAVPAPIDAIEESFEAEEDSCDISCILPMFAKSQKSSLDDLLRDLDAGFSETLLQLIDRTGKKDSEIYKKANIDRKLFSKIRNNPDYRPTKATVLAFALALELDLQETKDFLARAGYALSHSSKFDIIVEFFIQNKDYDVFRLNEVLFAFDQPLIGG